MFVVALCRTAHYGASELHLGTAAAAAAEAAALAAVAAAAAEAGDYLQTRTCMAATCCSAGIHLQLHIAAAAAELMTSCSDALT